MHLFDNGLPTRPEVQFLERAVGRLPVTISDLNGGQYTSARETSESGVLWCPSCSRRIESIASAFAFNKSR
jgi:hypothetical protein